MMAAQATGGLQWRRCIGLSSSLGATADAEVFMADLDSADHLALAIMRCLGQCSNILAIATRKGAHLVGFDLMQHDEAQRLKADLEALGQDPQHTAAHARYGRSVLRVSSKYGDLDLRAVAWQRDRRHARPWSGPHWDFYRDLLRLPALPAPGPADLRVEGDGCLILECYYTPMQAVVA